MSNSAGQEIAKESVNGFYIARGLFSHDEVSTFTEHYMAMNRDQVSAPFTENSDPLDRFPRIMQPHRYDKLSLDYLLNERLRRILTSMLGREPLAVQTMVYFKPPGARGQALHQDQYYLRVKPGTCMAAWLALDDCDVENGCLQVVPGTQDLPTLCPHEADLSLSFVREEVQIPTNTEPINVIMKAGDVLFFNGSIIHGSLPNISTTRFRRSLIAHYIAGEAEQVSRWYFPVLDFDGNEVSINANEDGFQCGVWVDENGTEKLEMVAMPFGELVERH